MCFTSHIFSSLGSSSRPPRESENIAFFGSLYVVVISFVVSRQESGTMIGFPVVTFSRSNNNYSLTKKQWH